MKKTMRIGKAVSALIASLLVICPALGFAQAAGGGFQFRTFRAASGESLPYRIFLPMGADKAPLPTVVYLHGSGGSGSDNRKQIAGGNTLGTHLWTTPEVQEQQPTIVVAPQIPVDAEWASADVELAPEAGLVLQLIEALSRQGIVDPDRVYLVGQSLGGFGVWDLISKRPEVFAAAVPLCGGGDPGRIAAARAVPVWAFHGTRDRTVLARRSREMVAALEAAKGKVKYTEYPEAGHDVWSLAFAEPELPGWLFSQRRNPDGS